MEHRTSLSQPSHYYGAPLGVGYFPNESLKLKLGFGFKQAERGERKLFPPLIHFSSSLRSSIFGRGAWQARHAPRTAAARRAQGAFASHLQQQVRSSDPAPPPTLRCPGTGMLGCSQHLPFRQSLPGPGDTDIRAPCALLSPLVLPSHTLALALNCVHTQRRGCLFFLLVSGPPPSLTPSPRPPPCSVCPNRTRGSPGCAHLTSGAGVAAQGSASPSAQRAARSVLRYREHPALTMSNGLFQQLGAEADLRAHSDACPVCASWRAAQEAMHAF